MADRPYPTRYPRDVYGQSTEVPTNHQKGPDRGNIGPKPSVAPRAYASGDSSDSRGSALDTSANSVILQPSAGIEHG